MTPGAGTAQSVGRVGRRQMWRGDGRFVVLYWPVRGIASVIRASQVAPLRLRVVDCCFASVIRASQVAPLRLRVVECCFASVIWASRVAPLRLWVVECCFASVIWASQVAPLRLRVVVGGVTRGCRRKGMGMKKRSRTDVAVSVWLLVVAEARLERTTSRL